MALLGRSTPDGKFSIMVRMDDKTGEKDKRLLEQSFVGKAITDANATFDSEIHPTETDVTSNIQAWSDMILLSRIGAVVLIAVSVCWLFAQR